MNDLKITQGMEWLNKEINKDQKEIDINKEKLIKEIKSIDRSKMFPEKKKKSFLNKLLLVLGYGKKG